MKPSTIRYFIREGLSGLKMNMLMTWASIFAFAACISILSFSYCVGSNLRYMLGQMEDSIGISVFLKGDLSGEQIENMKDEIAKIDHVQSVEYISPSDALVELKKDWGADEDIFVGLDGENNPLSHSFSISLDNIENQDAVLTALEKIDGIDNIRHGQTETEVLLKASRVFNVGSVLVMLLLGVISIMIIINTIRISVMNRRVEINIMKYVGATDWFIRWPFIVEGIIIGIIGALVPLVLGLPIYTKVTSAIFDYLPMIKFIQFRLTGDVFGFLFPFGIIFGVALGVIGSVSSIRKHLRV